MRATEYVSTALVARALGVSITTVKRWVDDGILPAQKTVGGHRKLLAADVLRLARDSRFPGADLGLLTGTPGVTAPADTTSLYLELVAALRQGEAARARTLLHGAYQAGLPVETLADEVIAPAMAQLGHDWEVGRIEVFHEHRGTQVCAAALFELKLELEAHAEPDQPRAVGGGPEHDPYFLSSLLAQMVLLDAGWDATNLGPHTPTGSLRRAMTELRPRLVWLSVSHLADPDRFVAEFAEFFREAERAGVAVAVGGRGLTEPVRAALRYTTFGDGLSQLAAFARTLHPRPRRPLRGRPPKSAS
jgi:MerR family transcriptional regulator, light-induced transcriptional regulator